MGFGDEIMASAEARRLHLAAPSMRVAFGRHGKARWNEVWAHNPRIAAPEDVARGEAVIWSTNVSGHRPYIDYEATMATAKRGGAGGDSRKEILRGARRWVWRDDFKVEPGEIWFSTGEKQVTADAAADLTPFVVVEPNVMAKAMPGKAWGFERYQALVDRAVGVNFVQLGPSGIPRLDGAKHLVTPTFRAAATIVAAADAYVGPEGGLHHASGALGIPGVVIFGGVIPPAITGYGIHRNLYADIDGSPCGSRQECAHCREAMASIAVDQVVAELEEVIDARR